MKIGTSKIDLQIYSLVSRIKKDCKFFGKKNYVDQSLTPPNFRVCAWQKVPAKRWKICHILYIWKPKVVFSFFSFIREKNKVARNEKRKQQLWVFVHIKYGKFSSVLLELFVEHKLWNWEEWIQSVLPIWSL